jgi:hypothetical protein
MCTGDSTATTSSTDRRKCGTELGEAGSTLLGGFVTAAMV